eukprot:CAMPEP_0197117376 /NCGR_PEP_ID=MMETSP1390-20130617/776_1 /TAXON_ID=38833 /ORGANISM="Micromonas sp., Strain CCMP2099" /LENGTH=56 /DNA_ID=CAMNT_0042558719 /DNA_START=6 /DNA_END=173 /DNA_ORIENTATION=-
MGKWCKTPNPLVPDARQQGQASHQYSESGGCPSQQAYQQQLAYAGLQQSASQPYWY